MSFIASFGRFLPTACCGVMLVGSSISSGSASIRLTSAAPALPAAQLAGGWALPPDSIQARTLRQGVARRQPGEAAEAFLQRLFPVALQYPDSQPKPIQYAWRPSAFGKQLIFSAQDSESVSYLDVFVLDPYQADTYAVKRFEVPAIGSQIHNIRAIFFADATHDGRKDLLVLAYSPPYAPDSPDGEAGRYYTTVFGYVPAPAGQRPRYVSYPRRTDLDDLETAAQVRQFLAFQAKQHVRKAPTHQ
jgi:hypothetical protein